MSAAVLEPVGVRAFGRSHVGEVMAENPAPERTATGRVLVTCATYNESENIKPLIQAILEQLPDANILVIDDNSPDGTGKLVNEIGASDPRVKALHRPGKLGLGSAMLDAIKYAIEHNYDFMLNLDADFSHSPKYLPALMAGMSDHDVMIGSRYIPGGGVEGWDAKRKFMSWSINVYSRLLLGLTARDTSGAFRCYRLSKLRQIDFARVYSLGYSFQEEFLYHCMKAGCRIGETPIVFENRKFGKSKINNKEALRALWCLFYTAIRR